MALAEIQKGRLCDTSFALRYSWRVRLRLHFQHAPANPVDLKGFANKEVGFVCGGDAGGETRSASWVLEFPAFAFLRARGCKRGLAGGETDMNALYCCATWYRRLHSYKQAGKQAFHHSCLF